jgi:hypothetical protein
MGFSAPSQRLATAIGDGTSTSLAITLTNNPTAGNLVIVMMLDEGGANTSLTSLQDANGNSYTVASPFVGHYGRCWVGYFNSVPSNASQNLTVVFPFAPGSGLLDVFAVEVPVSGGSVIFDQFVGSSPNSSSPVTSPSFTPFQAGEFFYSAVDIVHTTTGVGGSWTSGGSNNVNGNADEYQISGTGSTTTVNYTFTGAAGFSDAVVACFIFSASSTNPAFEDDSFNVILVPPVDPIISVW